MRARSRTRRLAAGTLLAAAALAVTASQAEAATAAKVTAGTLTVKGDGGDNKIALLIRSTSPDVLRVDVGDDGRTDFAFKRDKFDRILVRAGGGNDSIRIDDSGGAFTDTEQTTLEGEAGADTLSGGFGAEVLDGGDGADVVTPGRGDDTARLGAGDDAIVWRPGDASDSIEGQGDHDVLRFNGSNASESIALSAAAQRLRLTRDVAGVVIDAGGLERVEITALGGTDTVTVGDLAGTGVKAVTPELGADAQADTVVVDGGPDADALGIAREEGSANPVVSGAAAAVSVAALEPANDKLVVRGQGGDDTMTAVEADGALPPLTLEGGEGDDAVKVDGAAGSETFTVTPNSGRVLVDRLDPAPSSQELGTVEEVEIAGNGGDDTISGSLGLATLVHLAVDGGTGNDAITGSDGADDLFGGDGSDLVTPSRGNDAVSLGPGDDIAGWNPGDGSDTIEGGGDQDLLRFDGSNASEKLELSANGPRLRFTRDVANVVMDVDGLETVDLDARGGTDTIAVGDLTGTGVTGVTPDLSPVAGGTTGDAATDTVIVDGSEAADAIQIAHAPLITDTAVSGVAAPVHVTFFEDANDKLVVRGRGGNDAVVAHEVDGVLGALGLEGGDGDDTLIGGSSADTLSGGAGDDTLLGKGGQDAISGGDDDDAITGGDANDTAASGAGDDVFTWNPGDDSDVLEGDAGRDKLEVNGGNGDEIYSVTPNGVRVRVDRLNPAPFTQDLGSVEDLEIGGNGGDDAISGSDDLASLIHLAVDGGTGNDTITGSDGADELSGGEGSDLVTPARGDDTALLGPGDDVVGWNPGDGSDTIDGDADQALLRFDGSDAAEQFELSADGSRLRLTRDVADVVMDVGGLEKVNLATRGAADTVTVGDLTGTGVTEVTPDLAAIAGGGADLVADQITVRGTSGDDAIDVYGSAGAATVVGLPEMVNVTGADATDFLAIESLGGEDRVSAATLSDASLTLSVDGGQGGDAIFGGQGADILQGGAGDDVVDGNQSSDVAILGADDDRFTWKPGDGSDVLEGRDGADAISLFGSNIGERIDVSANGSRLRLTRDVGSVVMDAAGIETVGYTAFGGADTVIVGDLSATGVTDVDADLVGTFGGTTGDGLSDQVIVKGTEGDDAIDVAGSAGSVAVTGLTARVDLSHAEPADVLTIDTLGGVDTVGQSGLVPGTIQLAVS